MSSFSVEPCLMLLLLVAENYSYEQTDYMYYILYCEYMKIIM